MRKQGECCRKKVQYQAFVSVNGERICGESSKRKYKCPIPVPPPPCEFADSQASLYYTPTSMPHRDEEERPKTSKPHRRHRRKIDVHITDRSKKCLISTPLTKVNKTCSNDYRPLDKRLAANIIPCTDSTSSDDLLKDQRRIIRNCKPERCAPPPIPKVCCCERPVKLPQREKVEDKKECCTGGKLHVSVRPKPPTPEYRKNCEPVKERKTKDCTVQTEFICQSHKACQVSSRKIATFDITAQTQMVCRAEKGFQIGRKHQEREMRDQNLQTEQEDEDEDEEDDEDYHSVGSRYERPTRVQGHAFPFVGESPSGNLKVAKHMVAFENKNIGILVADPTKTKLWHKELQDYDEQIKSKGKARRQNSSQQDIHKTHKQYWHYSPKQNQYGREKTRGKDRRQVDPKPIYYTPEERESHENSLDKMRQQIGTKLGLGLDHAGNNKFMHSPKENAELSKPPQQDRRQVGKKSISYINKEDDIQETDENSMDKLRQRIWTKLGLEDAANKKLLNMPKETAKSNKEQVEEDDDFINPKLENLNESQGFRPVKESELTLHELPSSSSVVPSQQDSGEYLHAEQHGNEIKAAITIQRNMKGFLARKQFKKIKHSAKVIQDALRGHWARKHAKENLNNTSESTAPNPIEAEGEGNQPTPESPHVLTVGPYLAQDLKVPRDGLLVLGGSDPTQPISNVPNSNTGREILMYSINSMTWTNVGALPEPRTHFGIAKIGYEVYIIGGTDPRYKTSNERNIGVKTVWKVHLKTGEWYFDSIHPRHLDNPRSHFGCAAKETSIYVFGGNDEEARALSTCQRFDTIFNTWTPIQAMDGPRVSMGVAVYEDHIWLAGGISKKPDKPVLKTVIYYDTVTDSWTAVQPLPLPRAFPTLVVAHGKLFFLGGAGPRNKKSKNQSSVPEVLLLDTKLKEWREAGVLQIARHGHAAVAIDHQIVVLGGVSSEHMGAIDAVEIFDLSTSHSHKVRNLYENLSGMGAVSLQ